MCDSLKFVKHPIRIPPSDEAEVLGEDDKDREAFCRLSAQTMSELIQEEPDTYTIKDVKVRYR
jgi:hypothetical protein